MILTSNQSWISDGHQLLPTSSAHIYTLWQKPNDQRSLKLSPNSDPTCSMSQQNAFIRKMVMLVSFPHAAGAIGVVHDNVVESPGTLNTLQANVVESPGTLNALQATSSTQPHGPSGLKSSLVMILTSNQSWISDGHQLLPTSSATLTLGQKPNNQRSLKLSPNSDPTCSMSQQNAFIRKMVMLVSFPHAAGAIGVVHDNVV